MTDREWLEAVRAEIARMADDMETQRRAYVDLIARSEELAGDLDRTSAAYIDARAELEDVYESRVWRFVSRLRRPRRGASARPPAAPPPTSSPIAPTGPKTPPGNTVTGGPPSWARAEAVPEPGEQPSVSIIVPTRDQPELLGPLLDTLRATAWHDLEVVLVDNGTADPEARTLLAECGHTVVRDERDFNFPRLVRAGVEASSGEVIVLLNNDIESGDPRWLEALVSALNVPGCGIAGGLLLYPDGRIQHAGIVLADGEPIHALAGLRPDDAPPGALSAPHWCSAVTGACMAVRRSTWSALGGLDPLFARNYNDVDLCLRAASAGLATVVTPRAMLTHKESATRGSTWDSEIAAEGLLFRARWADQLDKADPYWPGTVDPRTGAVGGSRP